jgi:tetratricopeptide (TPR) repeat protein
VSRRVAVPVLLAALFAATTALNGWYHDQRAGRARAHRHAGDVQTAHGQLERGVEEYRAALLLERDDPESKRALALALLRLGRLSEAESHLIDLLRRDPVSGPLNLGLARIHSQRGADGEARRLYQRAIYGEWTDVVGGRMDARFELAEYLQAHGTRDDMLAELLRLKAELPEDATAAARRLAGLLLQAAAPDHAIDVLRPAVATNPRDVELLAALAEAYVRTGQSADARRMLRRAVAIDPDRLELRERLQVIDRALTLDPTLPNLRLTTRARRARDLLSQVHELTAACAATPAAGAARRAAQQRLQRRRAPTVETAEDDLAAASQLWDAAGDCRAPGPDAQAVSQVIERLRAVSEDPPP